MTPSKLAALFGLLGLLAAPVAWGGAQTTRNSLIFDNKEFWESYPANAAAPKAWASGVRWTRDQNSQAVYFEGQIFGFSSLAVPIDKDSAVQARLKAAYAERAAQYALNAAGLFAFNDFQYQALAGFKKLPPDINLCGRINVQSKMFSEWRGQAFGLVQISADEVTSCRKALDNGEGDNNANTFFGEIARSELTRLSQSGNMAEVLEFFAEHYQKKIFMAPELLLVAEAYARQGQPPEALVVLNGLSSRFESELDSEQLERCGDLYYSLGQAEAAIKAYERSSRALHLKQ